jgi:hypothetical protein
MASAKRLTDGAIRAALSKSRLADEDLPDNAVTCGSDLGDQRLALQMDLADATEIIRSCDVFSWAAAKIRCSGSSVSSQSYPHCQRSIEMSNPEYFSWFSPSGNPSRDEADRIRAHEQQNNLRPAQQQPNETYASWEYRSGPNR